MTPRLAEQLLSRRVEGLYVCVVGPSEAVYIPQGWHHATLNLGETLSVGTQLPVSFEQKTTPYNPADVTTALEAAWYGERLHASGATDGGGASAIAYLQRAVDVEVRLPSTQLLHDLTCIFAFFLTSLRSILM